MPAFSIAAVLVATVTGAGKPAQRAHALLTLASGHTFRVLNAGPVVDEAKKRLGIAYISSAQNAHELQADADELFDYLLPRAEEQSVPEIVVIAWLVSGEDLVEEYCSEFGQRPNALDSVTMMPGDDGKWRVGGYSVR